MNVRVLSIKPTWLSARLVSSFTVLPVSMVLQWFYLSEMGLDLQCTLGAFELSILAPISLSGILCRLSGVKVSMFRNEYEKPDNFTWGNFWPGEGSARDQTVCIYFRASCLSFLLIISSRSFIGYASVNIVLSDPVRAIKLAAPLAVLCAAVDQWRTFS